MTTGGFGGWWSTYFTGRLDRTVVSSFAIQTGFRAKVSHKTNLVTPSESRFWSSPSKRDKYLSDDYACFSMPPLMKDKAMSSTQPYDKGEHRHDHIDYHPTSESNRGIAESGDGSNRSPRRDETRLDHRSDSNEARSSASAWRMGGTGGPEYMGETTTQSAHYRVDMPATHPVAPTDLGHSFFRKQEASSVHREHHPFQTEKAIARANYYPVQQAAAEKRLESSTTRSWDSMARRSRRDFEAAKRSPAQQSERKHLSGANLNNPVGPIRAIDSSKSAVAMERAPAEENPGYNRHGRVEAAGLDILSSAVTKEDDNAALPSRPTDAFLPPASSHQAPPNRPRKRIYATGRERKESTGYMGHPGYPGYGHAPLESVRSNPDAAPAHPGYPPDSSGGMVTSPSSAATSPIYPQHQHHLHSHTSSHRKQYHGSYYDAGHHRTGRHSSHFSPPSYSSPLLHPGQHSPYPGSHTGAESAAYPMQQSHSAAFGGMPTSKLPPEQRQANHSQVHAQGNRHESAPPSDETDSEGAFARRQHMMMPPPPPPPPPPYSPPQWNSATTTGVQTFVTAIGVGDGTRTIQAAPTYRNVGTATDPMIFDGYHHPPASLPPSVVEHSRGHHRKLSSFSSLGPFVFHDMDVTNSGHRQQHSIGGFDEAMGAALGPGLEAPDRFLQDLHAPLSPEAQREALSRPEASAGVLPSSSTIAPPMPRYLTATTSKRVRRKCSVVDCPNRVVQGGLCISHGAKRKTCSYPGCIKNVKKAGLCSTHGPARRRCDAEGCTKVAVQGGRCIGHGAKKKLCCAPEGCSKQAILAGMCKKHHDKYHGTRGKATRRGEQKSSRATDRQTTPSPSEGCSDDSSEDVLCVVIDEKDSTAVTNEDMQESRGSGESVAASGGDETAKRPRHKRGFSIFQDMGAVDSIIDANELVSSATPKPPEESKSDVPSPTLHPSPPPPPVLPEGVAHATETSTTVSSHLLGSADRDSEMPPAVRTEKESKPEGQDARVSISTEDEVGDNLIQDNMMI